jgi:peptidoglycan/LPS O-acetylase OafA/YrhL
MRLVIIILEPNIIQTMPKQIDALTATRGFAAIAVVIFHFGLDVFPFNHIGILKSGNLAVSYFFVLSGFVMLYTYENKTPTYREFIIKRIARIVPLYLLAILISIAPAIVLATLGKQDTPPDFWTSLFLNITFLQAYVPGYVYGINNPGWSLSVEMMFYALFPFLLLLYRKNFRGFVTAVIIFFVLSQAAHLIFAAQLKDNYSEVMHQLVYYNPIFHFNEFLVGMLGAYMLRRYEVIFTKVPSLVILIATFAVIYWIGPYFSMHNGLVGPLFLLFIIAVAAKEPKFLQSKALVYFGDISYGIYILQKPLIYYVYNILNPKILHLGETSIFYVYLLVLIVVSALSYSFIEKPLRNRINKLAKRRKALVPQV